MAAFVEPENGRPPGHPSQREGRSEMVLGVYDMIHMTAVETCDETSCSSQNQWATFTYGTWTYL